MRRRTASLFLLWAALALPAGCTGVELAAIGAASSGLKTGHEVSRSGKLTLAHMAEASRVVEAARRASEQLGLTVHEVEQRGQRTWVLRISDHRRAMRIIVEQRAAMLTQVEVNVGLFGPKSIAELIHKRIIAELELAPNP